MTKTIITTTIGGSSLSSSMTRSQESEQVVSLSLPAGLAGTLSTRTDDDTGVLTVATGHGITTDDTVAVFWDGGSQYNVDVTAVAATTISIDVGDGTVLPAATTAIIVSKQLPHAVAFTGDSLNVLAISCRQRASIEFFSSAPASLLRYDMATNEGRTWVSDIDVTNPLAGDTVATVRVANGSTTLTTLELGILASTN